MVSEFKPDLVYQTDERRQKGLIHKPMGSIDDSPAARKFIDRESEQDGSISRLRKPSDYFSPKTSISLDRSSFDATALGGELATPQSGSRFMRMMKNRTLAESGLRMVTGDSAGLDTRSRQNSSVARNREDDGYTRQLKENLGMIEEDKEQ